MTTHVQMHRKGFIFSLQLKHGRIDIYTSTRSSVGIPEAYNSATEVVLNLPGSEFGSAQIQFSLSQNADQYRSISMTPMISVRSMRPSDSIIFEIAAHGTAEDLIDMVLAGEASLVDRDGEGRSLINVSILKLSEIVTDILVVCNFLL
jgi:hypothetical protein